MMLFDLAPAVTAAVSAAEETTGGMGFFALFQIVIGAYLLWSGIRGKGKIFENTSVKKERADKYVSGLRKLVLIIAPLVIIPGVLELTGVSTSVFVFGIALSQILWFIGLLCLVALVAYTIRYTDKSGKGVPVGGAETKKSPAVAADERRRAHMRAAYEFDEDDNGGAEAAESNNEGKDTTSNVND